MAAAEFRDAKNLWPDFLERVGRVFRNTPYGYDPANVYISYLPPKTIREIVGTQLNDLPKDIQEFRAAKPDSKQFAEDLIQVYADAMLPNASNTLVPGSDKTFAELGLAIDSTLVVEEQDNSKELPMPYSCRRCLRIQRSESFAGAHSSLRLVHVDAHR